MDKLPGDYVAGFVDGEGCFALKFRRDVKHERKGKPIYFYWDIEFAIVLREDDGGIIQNIRDTLGCGKISISRKGQVRYSVNRIDDLLDKVVPFFERYRLRAKKRFDFELWTEALEILSRNQQTKTKRKGIGFAKVEWGRDDLKRLREIQEEMREFKSKRSDWKWIAQV
ncbi:MAG: LAGLIDADG family homing endonuclease [Candidatus Liptonbacteria bacterium]|nr:LAGLIDADG family homing endonuclease [Candidatus Liptonbacteria bacterium]